MAKASSKKASQATKAPKRRAVVKAEPKRKAKERTRILIKYDVGMNNKIYIRGHGGGLSWDRGVLLENVSPDEWIWESDAPFADCEFKVLVNDQMFEMGENHHIANGTLLQYTPKFTG